VLREARAAARLNHPGGVTLYDVVQDQGGTFIVMELVEGETLAERIAARGRLAWEETFALGEQVARALAAAHGCRLVHRDVKPGNVLIGPDGRAKVTDFGIAKAATSSTLTRTGMVLGSANYVAPEQAKGDRVGPAADLYALGCVLFEAVTGRTPYAGRNPAARLIRRAMAKEPGDRFASASAMADLLASVLSGRSGVPARRSSWWALGAGTLVGMTPLLLALRPIPRAGVDHGDEDN
jgi:serine/threonine protein kinase